MDCGAYRMSVESYYVENRDRVLEKTRRPIQCPCGATVKYGNLSYHRKSVKHLIYEQSRDALRHQTLHIGTG